MLYLCVIFTLFTLWVHFFNYQLTNVFYAPYGDFYGYDDAIFTFIPIVYVSFLFKTIFFV